MIATRALSRAWQWKTVFHELRVLSCLPQCERCVSRSPGWRTFRFMLQAKAAVQGVPNPSQFAAKAQKAVKKVSGSVPSNPAADFAAKAKKTGNKLSSGAISNPAKDFANAVRHVLKMNLVDVGLASH